MRLRHVYLILCVLGFVLPEGRNDDEPCESSDLPHADELGNVRLTALPLPDEERR